MQKLWYHWRLDFKCYLISTILFKGSVQEWKNYPGLMLTDNSDENGTDDDAGDATARVYSELIHDISSE